jgi:hypothetical protein
MRWILLCLAVLSASLVFGVDTRVEEVGKSPVEAKFASGGWARIQLCSSGIELIGRDENILRVTYDRANADVKVRIKVIGDHAEVRVEDCPRNNFRIKIEMPKKTALQVRVFAGELDVRDVVGDKDMELHFGQLNIAMGNPDDYRRVSASVNSGELDAPAFHISKGGLFRSFEQKGPGEYLVHAHVGAGEIDMR